MQAILKAPDGKEMRIDLMGYSPRNSEMLGEWLMHIFSQMSSSPVRMPLQYTLEIR